MDEKTCENHDGRPASYIPGIGYRCVECTEQIVQRDMQPVFTLKAQDITAALVVDFWVMLQKRVRAAMDAGATMREAVWASRYHFGVPEYRAGVFPDDAKLDGASGIARAMAAYKQHKLAD